MAKIEDVLYDFSNHAQELIPIVVKVMQAKQARKETNYAEFDSVVAKIQADLAKLNAEVRK